MDIMLLVSGVIVIFATAAVVQDVIIRKAFDFTWARSTRSSLTPWYG
jgi:hypothetical protein